MMAEGTCSAPPKTIDLFIQARLGSLGISRGELIRRLGYGNAGKAGRRLDELCAGDFQHTRDLVARLPAALECSQEEVLRALEATRAKMNQERGEAQEQEEAAWRASFRPHAIIITEHLAPTQIFFAAIIRAEKRLRINLNLSQGRASFARQALARLPEEVPFFGRPIGFVVNYAPNRAVRFDLDGKAIELMNHAIRPGRATASIQGRELNLAGLMNRMKDLRD